MCQIWVQECKHGLVDESVPEHRDALSSCRELSSEPRAKVVSGKHIIYTHFPKDRNCEICQRTKITRAPYRRHTGGSVLRAEIFGDLITADHKVLSENCVNITIPVQSKNFSGNGKERAKVVGADEEAQSHLH